MKAIVTGVSGQDGYYMSELLMSEGYHVIGVASTPDAVRRQNALFGGKSFSATYLDFFAPHAIDSIIIEHKPSLFFNFAALATGSGMFDNPSMMSRVNGGFVLDVLEAARRHLPELRICQASSAEMFGDSDNEVQDETCCFRPKSPYGAAKLFAHNLISIYRTAFSLHCSSAILFNHESVRRPESFVTRKIARAAAQIKLGQRSSLSLGSLDAKRDWGYAPEYVAAMYRMATCEQPNDFVVSTGRHTSLETICKIAFDHVGLDFRDYVRLDSGLIRPIETKALRGSSERIFKELGWRAETPIETVIKEMVDADMVAFRSDQ